MRVVLIAGGWSSERHVSLAGARNVEAALHQLGHDVSRYDPEYDLDGLAQAVAGADFAFINLHGAPGEDGIIQAMLDALGCPYQGTGPAGSFLALHKSSAKAMFATAGLPTPKGVFLPKDPGEDWTFPYSFPAFVKPNLGGSSLGMGRVEDAGELRQAVEGVWASGDAAIIEEAAPGVELTCAIVGQTPMPIIMITPKHGTFFDYASKYEQGGAEELCPAPIPEAIRDRVQAMAMQAHRALGLDGYSRADFIWDEKDSILLLEVNTLPGMTATSLVPQAAAAAGLDFPSLIARLIELGLARATKSG